jgi:hypothetical protein
VSANGPVHAASQPTDPFVARLIALGAILAPSMHTLTDVMEWAHGGFSALQLWLNYLAFLPLPAILIGLYTAQRPRISKAGLAGAVGYGFAFIYFTHTTLVALAAATPDYQQLWGSLGAMYTAHGGLMIVSGFLFGWATLRAGVFPPWTAWTFLCGVAVNLGLGLLPVPDILQTAGTLLRNAGLIGMGWSLARRG